METGECKLRSGKQEIRGMDLSMIQNADYL